MPLKTKPTKLSVSKYINSIENETRRKDAKTIIKLMKEATKSNPKIWGDNFIIGFGDYTYKRKGGKEEFQWFSMGFAPRKTKLTLYLTCSLDKEPLVKKLGKCKYGKGCLHMNKLDDVDLTVLKKLINKYKDAKWFN